MWESRVEPGDPDSEVGFLECLTIVAHGEQLYQRCGRARREGRARYEEFGQRLQPWEEFRIV